MAKKEILQDTNEFNSGNASQSAVNAGAGFVECVLTPEQIADLNITKNQYITELNDLLKQLEEKEKEKLEIQQSVIDKQNTMIKLKSQCDTWIDYLTKETTKLNDLIEGTLTYEKQRDLIAYYQNKVDACLKKANLNISTYDTIFITSYCNTNEYEGDITVYGDPTWNSDVELLHACGSMGYVCPSITETLRSSSTEVIGDKLVVVLVLKKLNGEDITDSECCKKIGGMLNNNKCLKSEISGVESYY